MQTEIQSGPLQEFPAPLLGIARDTVTSPSAIPTLPTRQPSVDLAPDAFGTFRGAIICLPVAVVMWVIIIAAVTHFLIR